MYHIIINPASRSGKGRKIWEQQVAPILKQEQIPYKPYFSQKTGDISKFVAEILTKNVERPLRLIILGGDGTINEALQGMPDSTEVILGYIPTGSSNDLARDLGIPKNPSAALKLILHTGHARPMDLAAISYGDNTLRRFAVSCGIGYDAAVCEEVARSKLKKAFNKIGLGKLTYLGIALKQLFATKRVTGQLTLDDNDPITIEKMLFTTGMVHRYEGGGFMFCPKANDNDGILDLCIAGNISKLLILFALPTAFKGKHYLFKRITAYQAKQFRMETSSPMWIHTDGEVLNCGTTLTVTCLPDAIQIMVPPTKKP